MRGDKTRILAQLSPAHNVPRDEALQQKMLDARKIMIELEKQKSDKNPVPEGAGDVLKTIVALENEVCSLPAFQYYFEEAAHAYMLNDQPQKALEFAASVLACAQVLENDAAQSEAFELLFKIAVFAKDFKMATHFLDEKKKFGPLESDLNEAYESMEALQENGLDPTPRFVLHDDQLLIAPSLMALLEGGPAEMAARLIRRAENVSLEEARATAATLSEEELGTMFMRR